MRLLEKRLEDGKEIFSQVSFDSWADAVAYVSDMFYQDRGFLVSFEESHFKNRGKALSLKNKIGKIIYQLKTI